MFGVFFKVTGLNGAISGSIKSKMAARRHHAKLRMNILLWGLFKPFS